MRYRVEPPDPFDALALVPDEMPLRVLGLDAMPGTRGELDSAYRAAVKRSHPDVVTDPEWSMDSLEAARRLLVLRLPEPETDNGITRGEAGSRVSGCDCVCEWEGCDRCCQCDRHGGHYCYVHCLKASAAHRRELRRAARADRLCEHCGATFTPTRSDARFCTPAHRHAAWRARTRR